MKDFLAIIEKAKGIGPKRIAVAVAEDSHVIESVWSAKEQGLADATLCGNADAIKKILAEQNIPEDAFEILHADSKEEACAKAVGLVREGFADTVMKGLVDTSIIMRAVLDKETGLRAGGVVSHANVFKIEGYDRFIILTDPAINLFPDVSQKADIIRNALTVAAALENHNPKVAIICPVEKVNEKIPSTVDAKELADMNKDGRITGCIIDGPLALDNAVSVEAAKAKGITSDVAGYADILVVPNLEVGNVLTKSIEYFSKCEKCGIVLGAKMPIILTSRASSAKTKMYSIALALLVAEHLQQQEITR